MNRVDKNSLDGKQQSWVCEIAHVQITQAHQSRKELLYLVKKYPTMNTLDISNILQRTILSIRSQANLLGIKKVINSKRKVIRTRPRQLDIYKLTKQTT